MREGPRTIERFVTGLPKISMPNVLVMAFVGGLAAAGNPQALQAQEFTKRTIDGAVHDCINISKEYPKGTEKPGIYYFPGGPTYYSNGHAEPPKFVIVTGEHLPDGTLPFSLPIGPEELKDAFEIDGMICEPEQRKIEEGDRDKLPEILGTPSPNTPDQIEKRRKERQEWEKSGAPRPPHRRPGELDLPVRPDDLPVMKPPENYTS